MGRAWGAEVTERDSPFNFDASQKVCGDFGASTGGFTQVLLEQGARRVYAIDVGSKQLHWKLRQDDRVVVMEGVNIRGTLRSFPRSWIWWSQTSRSSRFVTFMDPCRLSCALLEAIVLVKPQFEVGKDSVGTGGKVRDEQARLEAIERLSREATKAGFEVIAGADCEVPGARAGNVRTLCTYVGGPWGILLFDVGGALIELLHEPVSPSVFRQIMAVTKRVGMVHCPMWRVLMQTFRKLSLLPTVWLIAMSTACISDDDFTTKRNSLDEDGDGCRVLERL